MKHKDPKPTKPQPSGSGTDAAPKWSYLSAVTLGLLSSSCCVIQLVLNAFSIGCAGFSVLTPFRPVFGSISFLLILYTVYKYRFSSRTALTLAITFLLSVTPEMVSVYNRSPSGVALRENFTKSVGAWPPLQQLAKLSQDYNWVLPERFGAQTVQNDQKAAENPMDKQPPPPPAAVPLIKYEVAVNGMACEACANRLRQYFISQPGIEHVKVFFDDKKMELWTRSGVGALFLSERNIQDMVAEVDKKYEAKLVATYSAGNKFGLDL
ncbi:MAG: hypothetical protein J3Q66DRAFT_391283 [Benniella sp.]|nr:MAG: hypothetical protein J3Q66DRAFT_391283 [Benniella sp.]